MGRAAMVFLSSALLAVLSAGCGSSGSSSSSSPSSSSSSSGQQTAGAATTGTGKTTTGPSVGALSAEATSAATGDIPDTQVFLTYRDPSAGYSISYPEGWTRKGAASNLTISDKNNIVHVAITKAGAATPAGVATELNRLKRSSPTLTFTAPHVIQLKSGTAVKVTYAIRSAPNPVTGKSVLLIVDRYELSKAGKRATVDLGTAKGVDNVDAYRMMINSFRWQ